MSCAPEPDRTCPPAPVPASPSAGRRPGEIRTLQYGRGVAAVLVVLFHADILSAKYFGPSVAGKAFRGGHSGVEFFFVLSGFIILAAHRGDVGSQRVWPYLAKRLVRLLPLYWLVMIPYGLAFLVVPSLNAERGVTLLGIARDMLFLSPEALLTLPPAWTLQHEALFYGVFALAIVDLRLGALVFSVWQGACLLVLLASPGPGTIPPLAGTVCSVFNVGFLFGIALALPSLRRTVAAHRRAAAAVGVVGAVWTLVLLAGEARSEIGWIGPPDTLALAYMAGYALLIVGLLAVPNIGRPTLDATLGVLGSASYAIYLVHLPAGSLALKILTGPRVASLFGPDAAFLCVALVGVVGGIALHVVVERPLLAALRARVVPSAGRPGLARGGVGAASPVG